MVGWSDRESKAYSRPAPRAWAPWVPFDPTIRLSDDPTPSSRRRSLGDRSPDEIAPLRPRAVVVAHLLHAEEVLEREPGMARPLADPAVGDDLVGAVDDARLAIQLVQLLARLEGPVGADRLGP